MMRCPPMLGVKQFVAVVRLAWGVRWAVFETGDARFYLFSQIDRDGLTFTGVSFPVAKNRLADKFRRALANGWGNASMGPDPTDDETKKTEERTVSNASDQLDMLTKARTELRKAEQAELDAANAYRAAKLAVRHAREQLTEVLDEAIDSQRQPRIPFDEVETERKSQLQQAAQQTKPASDTPSSGPVQPPPKWRDLTLLAAGYIEGSDAWPGEVSEAVAVHTGVATCGELADRLLAGERFGLDVADLQQVYADIEMLSEDDETPIQFPARVEDEPEPEADGHPYTCEAFKGDWIGALGFDRAKLDKSSLSDKLSGKAPKEPVPVKPITLDGRPYLVAGWCHQWAHSSWSCYPLYEPADFKVKFPDRELRLQPKYWEGMPQEERSNSKFGVRVRVGKQEYVIGPMSELRRLTTKNPAIPFDPKTFDHKKEQALADAPAPERAGGNAKPESGNKPAKSEKKKAEPGNAPAAPVPPVTKPASELYLRLVTGFPVEAANELQRKGV